MTEPTNPYEILDVFTDTPLQGNPLAVFLDGESIPSRLMQATARELQLSETVFVLPGDEDFDAQLRIFTPSDELPFAGHPTLGAAFVVGEHRNLATVRLLTGAGLVPVTLTREHGQIVYGEMEQPLPTVDSLQHTGLLLEALGVAGTTVPIDRYINGPHHAMVGLQYVDQVTALAPEMAALARAADQLGISNVSCFAISGENTVKTRVFCPGLGVPEDPATGSAAGPLALHLARHGVTEFGQTIEITQGVEIQRPSRIFACAEGDASTATRITVGGSAVRVAQGHFRLQ